MIQLAKTEHIEIEKGTTKGRDYFIVWYFEHGKMVGFNKCYDSDTAFKMAERYLRVTHGYHIGTTDSTGEAGQSGEQTT